MDTAYAQAIAVLTEKIAKTRAMYYKWRGVNESHARSSFLVWRIEFAARAMLIQGLNHDQLWAITCKSKGILHTSACTASVTLTDCTPKQPRYYVLNPWGE